MVSKDHELHVTASTLHNPADMPLSPTEAQYRCPCTYNVAHDLVVVWFLLNLSLTYRRPTARAPAASRYFGCRPRRKAAILSMRRTSIYLTRATLSRLRPAHQSVNRAIIHRLRPPHRRRYCLRRRRHRPVRHRPLHHRPHRLLRPRHPRLHRGVLAMVATPTTRLAEEGRSGLRSDK